MVVQSPSSDEEGEKLSLFRKHLSLQPNHCDGYWGYRNFWSSFLLDDQFDHWHFVQIFCTLLAEAWCRRIVLERFLRGLRFRYTHCDNCNSIEEHLAQAKHSFSIARSQRRPVCFSWKYPPLQEASDIADESHRITHYTLLIIQPAQQAVLSFDSRGAEYAANVSPAWGYCVRQLHDMARATEFRWVDMNYFDIQSQLPYDHFCQTWSILLALDALCETSQACFSPSRKGCSLVCILNFWKFLVAEFGEFREACYYEIYRKTHGENGEKIYDRYFTTLEALLHGGKDGQYLCPQGYDACGYTFLEDFLHIVDEETFCRILS